ncbi:MAG: universal stress protein, partial [Polyangiaceae bacterium]|nr:universal stress protein [Polyangiaceae bacterium]
RSQPLVSALAPLGPVPALPDDEAIGHAQATATTILQDLLSQRGIDGDAVVTSGPDAAAAIVARAKEIGAALIVVGTRGRTGLARMTLGSVAEQVVALAQCSVLAVRMRG